MCASSHRRSSVQAFRRVVPSVEPSFCNSFKKFQSTLWSDKHFLIAYDLSTLMACLWVQVDWPQFFSEVSFTTAETADFAPSCPFLAWRSRCVWCHWRARFLSRLWPTSSESTFGCIDDTECCGVDLSGSPSSLLAVLSAKANAMFITKLYLIPIFRTWHSSNIL